MSHFDILSSIIATVINQIRNEGWKKVHIMAHNPINYKHGFYSYSPARSSFIHPLYGLYKTDRRRATIRCRLCRIGDAVEDVNSCTYTRTRTQVWCTFRLRIPLSFWSFKSTDFNNTPLQYTFSEDLVILLKWRVSTWNSVFLVLSQHTNQVHTLMHTPTYIST